MANLNQTVGVVIPTWRRPDQLRLTLEKILQCHPAPDEVIVHVDAHDPATVSLLGSEFADSVICITSEMTQGPGGGRNKLFAVATAPVIVCLDDDSWPLDADFFARAMAVMNSFPDVAVIAASVAVRNSNSGVCDLVAGPTFSFENCGCIVRRKAFLETAGYLSLRYAYGMEEVDVALQLIDRGWRIIAEPELRVFHDTEMAHHSSPAVNAAQITNTGLLAFLRYPAIYWPLALMQIANRVRYSVRVGRYRGVMSGILSIPFKCWDLRSHRRPVNSRTIKEIRRLRGSAG